MIFKLKNINCLIFFHLILSLSFLSIAASEKKEQNKISNDKNLLSVITNICDIQNIIASYIGFELVEGKIINTQLPLLDSVQFTPDNKFICHAPYGDIRIFDCASLKCQKFFAQYGNAISHDGKTVAIIGNIRIRKKLTRTTKSLDNKLQLRDINTGDLIKEFKIGPDNIEFRKIIFSNNDKYLAILTSGPQEFIYIVNIESEKLINKISKDFKTSARSIKFSSNDNNLLLQDGSFRPPILIIDVLSDPKTKELREWGFNPEQAIFSPDNKHIACVNNYSKIKIFNIENDKFSTKYIADDHEKYVNLNRKNYLLSYCNEGKNLIFGTTYFFLIWNVEKDQYVQGCNYFTRSVPFFVFSNDNRYLMSICWDWKEHDDNSNFFGIKLWHNLAIELLADQEPEIIESNNLRNTLCSVQ